MILSSHQKYVLERLPDLNVKEFYIHFGFKSRQNGEIKFKQAIEFSYEDTGNEELKEYIKSEYIEDDFEILNSTILDEYWLTTQRQVNETQTLKRKAEITEDSQRKSPKDRRLSSTTTKAGIIDLSNEGPSGQASTIKWKQAKASQSRSNTDIAPLQNIYQDAVETVFNNKDHINEQFRKTLKLQINCNSEDLYFYKLLSHIIETHQINADLYETPDETHFSEKDYDIILYGRILNLLFSNRADIKVKSGETKFNEFKVDYRVGFLHKNIFHDVSHIELGKAPTVTKIKDDHTKILLESKEIIRHIINKFSFIRPSGLKVLSLQLCGLKGDIIRMEMTKPKVYIADRVGQRLRVPPNTTNAEKVMGFFSLLLHYRHQVIKSVNEIKEDIHDYDDRRRSLEKVLGPKIKRQFVTYQHWISD